MTGSGGDERILEGAEVLCGGAGDVVTLAWVQDQGLIAVFNCELR